MAVSEILLFMSGVVAIIYYWCKHNYSYWKRYNVPQIEPTPFIGNTKEMFTLKNSFGLHLCDIYKDPVVASEPVVGVYVLNRPALLIREPEIIKSILIKDFNKFSNRYSAADPHGDALGSNNLFFVKNPHWKEIRTKVSPVFTSGKIKTMYPLMLEIAANLEKHLETLLRQESNSFVTEVKEVCANFTTDLIATVAFGLHANSLQNPNAEFRQQGRKFFNFTLGRAKDFFLAFFLPDWVSFCRVKIFSVEFSKFLRDTINYVISERERSGTLRNDLIDILVTLKKEATSITDETHFSKHNDFLVAQAAVFLTAGFETSSSTMSFALYEFAKKPELQKRLRDEIVNALVAENGKLSYDTINSLEYLSMVLDEVLRLYPVLPFLDRQYQRNKNDEAYSLKPYHDFELPNGMPVYIPVFGLQRDAKYWPDPNTFDPERFSPENKKQINPMAYMPFGTGPHNCIGTRIGLLQAKIGLVHFFKNHYVTTCDQTVKEMQFDPKAFILQCRGGIYLNIVNDRLYDKKIEVN